MGNANGQFNRVFHSQQSLPDKALLSSGDSGSTCGRSRSGFDSMELPFQSGKKGSLHRLLCCFACCLGMTTGLVVVIFAVNLLGECSCCCCGAGALSCLCMVGGCLFSFLRRSARAAW